MIDEPKSSNSLTTEGAVYWKFEPVFDAAHRAALQSGKALVYVCPPAAWAVSPLLARLAASASRPALVALVPETEVAAALGERLDQLTGLRPSHACTGLARTERLLRQGSIHSLAVTVPDALELVTRAALKLEAVPQLLIGWPESIRALGQSDQLDALLAEAGHAQRLIVTSAESAAPEFLERHAYRAPVVPAACLPAVPLGTVWYAVSPLAQRKAALRALLDLVNPVSPLVWDPDEYPSAPDQEPAAGSGDTPAHDWAVALDLPSADLLAWISSQAKEVAVLVSASQLHYLERLASPSKPLKLTAAPDRARDLLFGLRQRVRDRLEQGHLTAELLALEPLFNEYDPALVAAAALSLSQRPPEQDRMLSAWVRIRVNLGRRDQIKVGDLVGALLNGVRLAKDDVGRIELHEGFALVDIRAPVAEQALRELNGMTLRGKRVSAVVDPR